MAKDSSPSHELGREGACAQRLENVTFDQVGNEDEPEYGHKDLIPYWMRSGFHSASYFT